MRAGDPPGRVLPLSLHSLPIYLTCPCLLHNGYGYLSIYKESLRDRKGQVTPYKCSFFLYLFVTWRRKTYFFSISYFSQFHSINSLEPTPSVTTSVNKDELSQNVKLKLRITNCKLTEALAKLCLNSKLYKYKIEWKIYF